MKTAIATLSVVGALLLCHRAGAAEPLEIHRSSFSSGGVKIAYVEAGAGPPVVLVHGLYSSAQMNWFMPGIFQTLAEHDHVVALDLRGHGDSDKPADDASYGQPMVEDIVALMDHLHIAKAHVVGYSLGGIIVMKLMIDHPDRVISGTLGGMGWLREGSFEQKIFEVMGDRALAGTPPACVHGIARLAVTRDQVMQIKVPVEILVGDHDPCRQMYVEPLRPLRTDWPVVVIDGAGHLTCVIKEQFKSGLVAWIAKNSN